jgi:hypothetical protein
MRTFIGFKPGTTDITATSNGNTRTRLSAILSTILASNGGLTQTYALVTGSPAIDAVNKVTCLPPATDQRGIGRPQAGNNDGGPACDIGAYELAGSTQPPPPPPPLTTAQCQSINATIAGTGTGATLTGTNGVDVIQSFAEMMCSMGSTETMLSAGAWAMIRSLRALTTVGYLARSAWLLVMVVRAGLRQKAASGSPAYHNCIGQDYCIGSVAEDRTLPTHTLDTECAGSVIYRSTVLVAISRILDNREF